ncbi:hypothetical protein Tco_1319848 [Tanacetum coccineum]
MNFQDSSEDSQFVPSKTDLDNLFGPLYEEYYATSSPEVSDNSAANTLDNENTSSSLSIVVEEDKAPQIVSSLTKPVVTEPYSPVLNENADELVQEDITEFDGNVHQSSRGIFICQSQYTIDLLKKHRMEKCDIVSTPMATTKLDADLQGTQVDNTKYHSMIGGLMYLTASRPDIAFATFVCARYQARPTEKHLKETMQGVMMIAKAHQEAFNFWEISYHLDENATARLGISLQQDSNGHVEKGTIEIYFVGTKYQLTDLFTKALSKERFEYLVHRIGDEIIVLQSIPCSLECKIVGQILLDHPLNYALTANADVPVVYLQQFWRTVSKVPIETPDNPFVVPVYIETIKVFLNKFGYQGVVDKTKINILQLFHAVINRTNVDYVALLWWDFMNNVKQKKEAIQYPRFTKLIIVDLMNKFLKIPKRIKEDYHSIKDDIPLVSVYTTGDVRVRGMLIPNEFMTEEIRATYDFKEYETMFMHVDVPINQSQPVISTKGTHTSTPRAHRTRTLTAIEKEKDDDDSEDRIEPESHKDNPEHVDDNDDKNDEKVDEEEGGEMGSLETRTKETQTLIPTTPRSTRTNLSSSKEYYSGIDGYFLHQGVSQLAEKATKELIENNLKACIAATIIEDRDAFRSEVPDLVSQEFNAQAPKIIEELFKNYMQSNVLKHKFEKSSTANTSYRDDDIHSHHDDHQEDNAPSEGEKRVKRHKASKSSKSAWEEIDIDEDEVIPKDETPELITELQDVDKRVPTIYDYERMKATLKDALIWESRQEDLRRPIPKPLVFFGPQRNPNEPPRITEVVRITTDQPHGLDFMEQIIVMREDDKPYSFSKADYKHLNKNDIENNLKACIAATIIKDRDAFHSEVPDLVSQEFNAQAPNIIEELFKNYMQSNVIQVLKHKFEKSSTANNSYMDDDIHSHHDDHQEDNAPPEGEKRVKRHKASKSLKSARGSSSKHSAKDSTTYHGNTEEKKYILSLHKIHAERFLEADLEEKINRWHRITEVVRITTDQPHGLDFMEQIIVMREDDKPYSFSKADFKYLNKNDIEDLYYHCRNKKLGIESYQIKVNLSIPTLTFLGIKAHEPYSIVDKPSTGFERGEAQDISIRTMEKPTSAW